MCDKVTSSRQRPMDRDGAQCETVGRPIEVRRIPAGTRVQIAGVPFELMEPAVVAGHPDNFARAAVEQVFPQPDPEETRPLSLGGHNRRF